MRGDMCPFDHGSDPVVVEDVNLPNMLSFQPPQIPGVEPPPPPGLPPPPPLMNAPPVNLRPPVPLPCALPPSLPPIQGRNLVDIFLSAVGFDFLRERVLWPLLVIVGDDITQLNISYKISVVGFFSPTQVPPPLFLHYNHQVWMLLPVPLPALFPRLSLLVFGPHFPRPRYQCLIPVSLFLTVKLLH